MIRKTRHIRLAIMMSAAAVLAGCARIPSLHHSTAAAPDNGPGSASHSATDHASADSPEAPHGRPRAHRVFRQSGVASWYGRAFNGRRTASGECFNTNAMTAAHRTLPLGSYARVTLERTGKSVIVRINDRGPFIRRRIIDLSYAAASALGIQRTGTSRVIVESVDSMTLLHASTRKGESQSRG